MLKQLTSLTLLALLAAPIAVEAQSHGRRCDTSDTGYWYTITTPAGDARQHDLDLYFNRNKSVFILLVFDDESDAVMTTSSGLQDGDRFVHGSLRLLPDKRYIIAVGCVLENADYRLSVKRGEEVRLSSPRVLGVHQGLDAGEAAASLEIESAMLKAKRQMQ